MYFVENSALNHEYWGNSIVYEARNKASEHHTPGLRHGGGSLHADSCHSCCIDMATPYSVATAMLQVCRDYATSMLQPLRWLAVCRVNKKT